MSFNSYAFLFLFLPLVWIAFRGVSAMRWPRAALCVLVLGSLAFYAYAGPLYLVLLAVSIAVNFALAQGIRRDDERSGWLLACGIALNLGLLAYFKYTNFLVGNWNALFGARISPFDIAAPIGISFLTFQQVAYLVDCRRGQVSPHTFLEYVLFTVYFPRTVQGPIVRFHEIMPQLQRPEWFRLDEKNVAIGLSVFTLGLFKKVVIADSLSPWVAAAFDGKQALGFADAWLGSLAFTFQIYFDFSGYSDMALGVGRLFNLEVPVNFDAPYKSKSLIEFWRRWHMTLSFFLRDYLYIPLGGSRQGELRRYVNLMITMLLGGLWHGAAWTFVAWGALHGAGLCINHGWRALRKSVAVELPVWIAWPATFCFVNLCWVLFRAPSFHRAMVIIEGMAGLRGFAPRSKVFFDVVAQTVWTIKIDPRILVFAVLTIGVLALPTAWRWSEDERRPASLLGACAIGLLFIVSLLFLTNVTEFIYEQF